MAIWSVTGPKGFEPLTYRSPPARRPPADHKSRSLYLTKLRAQGRSKRRPLNERIVGPHGGLGQWPTIASPGRNPTRSTSTAVYVTRNSSPTLQVPSLSMSWKTRLPLGVPFHGVTEP